MSGMRTRQGRPRRVLVVGSGTRFLSGISVYTVRLANALVEAGASVSLISMRQLLPTRLYPGRERVGAELSRLEPDPRVRAFDGIDWFWVPSLLRASLFMGRNRPETMILQWWSGTVLHSYLALSVLARMMRMRVIIEFHEVLDTAEARIPLARAYARLIGQAVVRMAAAYAVHSDFDREQLRTHWPLRDKPVIVTRFGPHDHYHDANVLSPARDAPDGVCNLLFFGVIRPYKGLEDLIEAFDGIPADTIQAFWLTVVGETWEGHTLPGQLIASSPYRDRITFVNRYVRDSELDAYLRGADAVVLPYRRSSLSGPLHVAMTYGLPVVISDAGGNVEAAAGYAGTILVPPAHPASLALAISGLPSLVGRRYSYPHSWEETSRRFDQLIEELEHPSSEAGPHDPLSVTLNRS